jgi:hypothetical protein
MAITGCQFPTADVKHRKHSIPVVFCTPEYVAIRELILAGEQLWERSRGLNNRYPSRILVPFARRQDSDEWPAGNWQPGMEL